jgi:hypothetical protein
MGVVRAQLEQAWTAGVDALGRVKFFVAFPLSATPLKTFQWLRWLLWALAPGTRQLRSLHDSRSSSRQLSTCSSFSHCTNPAPLLPSTSLASLRSVCSYILVSHCRLSSASHCPRSIRRPAFLELVSRRAAPASVELHSHLNPGLGPVQPSSTPRGHHRLALHDPRTPPSTLPSALPTPTVLHSVFLRPNSPGSFPRSQAAPQQTAQPVQLPFAAAAATGAAEAALSLSQRYH